MVSFLKENLWQVLLGINYLLVVFFSILIVLRNNNPARTLAYLFAMATLPFLGLLVYYFVGQDHRKDKIFEKKYFLDDDKLKKWREKFSLNREEREDFAETFGYGMYKIYNLLKNNEKAVLTFDNDVEILVNGERKFKKLREDLQKAKNHIHLEYFVIFDDEVGNQIIDILCKKASEGVKVRMIYDDVGSDMSSETKKKLDKSKIEHYPFMPVIFTKFTSKFNYRDHRKIVVIDGTTGYVGGINIDKKYDNTCDNDRYWRDTHVRLHGSAVGALQSSFLLSWEFVSAQEIELDDTMFPKHKAGSDRPVAVQIAESGPDTDWENIMEAIFTGVNSAREYIYITTPYLIPNSSILTSLTTAARSGVDVRILIPYKSDSWPAQFASDSYIEQLLESRVKIFRYKKGFVHSKTLVIDDIFSIIGTANLDYRSFSINFEINALIYNDFNARKMKSIFMKDLKDSEEVILERWQERGIMRKLQESFNRLWAPLL